MKEFWSGRGERRMGYSPGRSGVFGVDYLYRDRLRPPPRVRIPGPLLSDCSEGGRCRGTGALEEGDFRGTAGILPG